MSMYLILSVCVAWSRIATVGARVLCPVARIYRGCHLLVVFVLVLVIAFMVCLYIEVSPPV